MRSILSLARGVCVVLLSLACTIPWGPGTSYHQIQPPPLYQVLWNSAKQCAQQTVPVNHNRFGEIWWFVVDSTYEFWTPTGWAVGTSTRTKRIYLAEQYMNHPMVIGHESVHQMTGIWAHPDDPFKRCHLTWDTYQGFVPQNAPVLP